MNTQDFAKQWEHAVEVLENDETLQVRSALVAGQVTGDCHRAGKYKYCQVLDAPGGKVVGSYNCTSTWTYSSCE